MLLPVIQFHRPWPHLWDGCRLAQRLRSLTPFRAAHLSLVSGTYWYHCFKAGMMLMGPQLCPVITAQPKRNLQSPWEVPVGEGRSKSIFISSGVCLLALDPLTEDSKCFPLSSVIPDGAVSSPSSGLVCSRKAELGMGCKCTIKQLRLALSFLPFHSQTPGTSKPNLAISDRNNTWYLQYDVCTECFTNRQYLILWVLAP